MWEQVNRILNQAVTQMLTNLASFLPGLVALLVILLLTMLLAWIAGAIIRRVLRRVQFDRRVDQYGFSPLAEWSPSRTPSELVARLAVWTIVLLGFLVGLSAFDGNMTNLLVMRLFAYLPDVIAAILIVVVGVFLARFIARGVLISAVNMQIQSARLLSLGVKWLIMVLTGAMALEHLGIGGQIVRLSFGILFGGIVLALSLAVGLGSKDIVSRSWERQADRSEAEPEETFHHL